MNDNKGPVISPPKKDIETIDRPNFDIVFQMGVIKLSLQDDYFCAQLVRYLSDDKDLEEFTIFDSEHLQTIFKLMVESFKQYSARPTEGQIRQKFNEMDEDYRMDLNSALDAVLSTDTHNDSFYRQYMSTFIQQVKMAKGFKKTKKIWKERPDNAPDFMQEVIDGIRRVSFEKEDILTMGDLGEIITTGVTVNARKIPTGIPKLDEDLVGGLPRENLCVVLAGTNVGKSMFAISLACNALRAVDENGQNCGYKVLHVNLEGMRDEAIKRYASNLAQVNYGALIQGRYDDAAKRRIDELNQRYGANRLMIRNMLGFGSTIEDLIAYCRELYKDFKFDMLIVDYGQLLDSKQKQESYRHTMARVFRGLTALATEFSCVVLTPAQATRGAQENSNQFAGNRRQQDTRAPVMRSTDIAEAMEIARVAGVIFSLNVTEEEGKQNRLRLFLEKQRQGAKNTLYGLITNYSQCNLITGKYYDATQTVLEGADVVDVSSVTDRAKQVKVSDFKKFAPKQDGPIEAKEVAPPQKPAAQALSSQEQEMEDVYLHFTKIKEDYLLVKTQYDDEREKDYSDPALLDELLDKLSKLREQMQELQVNSRVIMSQIYPSANKEQLEEIKKQYRDAKLSGDGDVEKLERIIRHYELGLGVNKVPN